jgi:pilus assembly protein CpaE
MQGIDVAILSEDRDRLNILRSQAEGTNMARVVYAQPAFPVSAADPIIRQIQDLHAELVIVDIHPEHPQAAVHAIEVVHSATSDMAVFAAGELSNPAMIVSAMRAGAREYVERQSGREGLAECLARYAVARGRAQNGSGRAPIFHFADAKAGSGATTLSVNIALALQGMCGKVVLVDLAPIGHAGLHLNLRPSFGVTDALQNLHRMDNSLLATLMTSHSSGLDLLAGAQQPWPVQPTTAELARLFDWLVRSYTYVIADCSSRMDSTARVVSSLATVTLLVTQTDVVSLWSAARVHAFLEEGGAENRVGLVLNRYKRIAGLSDRDVEKAVSARILWKVPNNFLRVAPAVDKGVPIVLQPNSEVGRNLLELAGALAGATPAADGSLDLSQQAEAGQKTKAANPFLISPLRAGH